MANFRVDRQKSNWVADEIEEAEDAVKDWKKLDRNR